MKPKLTEYHCPKCGEENVKNNGSSLDEGDMFVGVGDEDASDVFEGLVDQLECGCGFVFYAPPDQD